MAGREKEVRRRKGTGSYRYEKVWEVVEEGKREGEREKGGRGREGEKDNGEYLKRGREVGRRWGDRREGKYIWGRVRMVKEEGRERYLRESWTKEGEERKRWRKITRRMTSWKMAILSIRTPFVWEIDVSTMICSRIKYDFQSRIGTL
jgi:hypothetical protein